MTQADLARAWGKPSAWVSRRIGTESIRPVSLNLDEIEQVALILHMPVPVLFGIGQDQTYAQAVTDRLPHGRHLSLVRAVA